ncbi:selenobiotic family peptide radical SAM maturase [Desulfopila sp. IMCC35006]|uniref:thio(seleno)oxazole modification radical SAM maturase SbtM n=1 Tax=Desulfopila sp. IMCC35006 TaxID=2569542 RepID=UPI0010ACE180|nr:thio(seleno)oxazole modification radical SAM maturase SbtM [Desulfopila sp. IMCC35006]TKB24021.1 selenobiotic family peptide radical SAM maturase [Desulfopila sp. IMCC35006]
MRNELEIIYPVSAKLLPEGLPCVPAAHLAAYLKNCPEIYPETPYLADLAAIELAAYTMSIHPVAVPHNVKQIRVHPGLELLEVAWLGLVDLLEGRPVTPVPGKGYILLVPGSNGDSIRIFSASNYDLLALKIIAEGIDSHTAARAARVSVGLIDNIVYSAGQKGLLRMPPSKIVRPQGFCDENITAENMCSTPSFTLQWHITQNCDLHCRHCYDRSDRIAMTLEQGLQVLDDFYQFCREHQVYGQVSFTGGNPLLFPHFFALYREAVERGFLTAVLGNPMDKTYLDRMLAINMPEFYQVSLEGLPEHNDCMRGEGHFDRTMAFLQLLREMHVFSMVMLTLTRENMDQVLPLAEKLKDKTDLFTFNRLAMMGEGAALASVDPALYPEFLESFISAAADNPVMRLKDNLCNLHLHRQGLPLQGGCAGVGCGAAFNFVSLLPDGEVHACRKMPSLLGNIYQNSLTEIYHTPLAERYRMGSSACHSCAIRPACGGCPAVALGFGRDIFTELDPYCFKENKS